MAPQGDRARGIVSPKAATRAVARVCKAAAGFWAAAALAPATRRLAKSLPHSRLGLCGRGHCLYTIHLRTKRMHQWWVWPSWLRRQIVALEIEGSSPFTHPMNVSGRSTRTSRFLLDRMFPSGAPGLPRPMRRTCGCGPAFHARLGLTDSVTTTPGISSGLPRVVRADSYRQNDRRTVKTSFSQQSPCNEPDIT